MRMIMVIWALFFAIPAQAESSLTADEFRRATEGKTYEFLSDGTRYGRETYLPGDRVIWDDLAGSICRFGSWYPQDGLLCFVYDDMPDFPRCWAVLPKVGGTHDLYFEDNRASGPKYTMAPSRDPLICTGPGVGA